MEDELRLSLLIVGSFFIIAVLAHGIWKIRKQSSEQKAPRREPKAFDSEDEQDSETTHALDEFDEHGIGPVRVVSQTHNDNTDKEEADVDTHVYIDADSDSASADLKQTGQPEPPSPEPQRLYGSVVTNPKPHMKSHLSAPAHEADIVEFPDPPGFLLREASTPNPAGSGDKHHCEVDDFSLNAQAVPPQPSENAEAQNKTDKVMIRRNKTSSLRRRQEPSFGDDQMRIDFDDSPKVSHSEATASESHKPLEQEVLVLNVKAKSDAPISGAAMLPLLLTLGFKFGDQDIFHRHVNSNGTGPVLFSLANMFKPGNFDIDNLENFSTNGISLFMILPIEGDPHQVFNMMHNAARKIADEFDAQVLDGRRSVLTRQGLQRYMEKIREFERKRIISRSES